MKFQLKIIKSKKHKNFKRSPGFYLRYISKTESGSYKCLHDEKVHLTKSNFFRFHIYMVKLIANNAQQQTIHKCEASIERPKVTICLIF